MDLPTRCLVPNPERIYVYANGAGVPKDSSAAINWLQRSASHGYAPAQSQLGFQYSKGDGVPKDLQQALKWWSTGDENGNTYAQVNLALMYVNGNGVLVDKVVGTKWHMLSIERGPSQGDATQQVDARKAYLREVTSKMNASEVQRAQSLADAWLKIH